MGMGLSEFWIGNSVSRRSSLARVLMLNPYPMDSRSSVVPELSGQTRDVISIRKGGRTTRTREQCEPEARTNLLAKPVYPAARPREHAQDYREGDRPLGHGTIGRGEWGNKEADR